MANADFDPTDKTSFYFGHLSRGEANEILTSARDSGVFLVRDSKTIKGDFVLCVKEDSRVSHYIINKLVSDEGTVYKIGEQDFPDIPSLLTFYKTHYLDTTSLIRAAPREKVVCKYDFDGKDDEDLPFKKNDVLTILQKDEEQWWTARNSSGRQGLIPVNYVQKYNPEQGKPRDSNCSIDLPSHRDPHSIIKPPSSIQNRQYNSDLGKPRSDSNSIVDVPSYRDPLSIIKPQSSIQNSQRELPAKAVVIQPRIPNAYDKNALRLQLNDIVEVTEMNMNGQWVGICNGKTGSFPFTHVKFESDEEN